MKVAIIGSRSFTDYVFLEKTLSDIEITEIISGGAKGTDKLAENFAKKYNIKTRIFYPDWKKYGRGAGFIRNKDIIENCDCVIAFWDGESKGTANSINIAKKLKKDIKIVKV